MIGRLRGTLLSKKPPWLLVEVAGVGYELEAPMSTIYDLPALGQEVTLVTHQVVKEDGAVLYGFLDESERALFRRLQKVSGVGAKIALAVLSGVSVGHFAQLVCAADVVALTKVPGIGKKTAERIILELRDQCSGLPGAAALASVGAGMGLPSTEALPGPAAEATEALQQLGYKPAEVTRLVHKVAAEGDSAETIIRKALRAALGAWGRSA